MKNYIQAHHTIGILGLAAVGALAGHYLVKKGNTWTIGLALVGAAGGWFIANQMGSSTTPSMTAAPAASAPATMPNV